MRPLWQQQISILLLELELDVAIENADCCLNWNGMVTLLAGVVAEFIRCAFICNVLGIPITASVFILALTSC